MRLSRPCYDKPHRCPGWAGGGWNTAKRDDRCPGGSVRTKGDDGYPGNVPEAMRGGYPRHYPWRFGRCTRCEVVTWPVAWCNLIDPSMWQWKVQRLVQRIQYSWDDYQSGDPISWIWRARWKRYR